jgi:hypothetical protein
MPGSDKLYMQGAMVPIDTVGVPTNGN